MMNYLPSMRGRYFTWCTFTKRTVTLLLLGAIFSSCDGTPSEPPDEVGAWKLLIEPAEVELEAGRSVPLEAYIVDGTGSHKTLSSLGLSAEWRSDSPGVADVTQNRTLEAFTKGRAEVTATVASLEAYMEVTVSENEDVESDDDEESGVPDAVTDLQVESATDVGVTLSWTEVGDGYGDPADYAIRYGSPNISWGEAYPTEVTVKGTAIDDKLQYTYTGLDRGREYEFQLVSYRGKLNDGAAFGDRSNKVSTSTEDGEDSSSEEVASITASPSPVTFTTTDDTVWLSATAKDSHGNTLSDVNLNWKSTDMNVITIDSTGMAVSKTIGSALLLVSAACCSPTDTVNVDVSDDPGQSPGAYFADSFEAGDLSHTSNGFNWGQSLSHDVSFAGVTDRNPRTGSHSLEFLYGGRDGSGWSEQRFSLGNEVDEIWFDYYIYFPDGSEEWSAQWYQRESSGSTGQKVWMVWKGDYHDEDHVTVVLGNPLLSGGTDRIGVGAQRNDGSTLDGFIEEIGLWRPALQDNWTPQEEYLGRWMHWQIYLKLSEVNQSNGEFRMYVDGVEVIGGAGHNVGSPLGEDENSFDHGYLMGYSGNGFSEDTRVFIDDFKVYNEDPGW